jgi:hypothetical protein
MERNIMSTKIVKMDDYKTPEQKAEEWLYNVPAKFLACIGFGHAFPKLRPNGRRPVKGITLRRFSDGSRELEMMCRDCGTTRTIVTEPGEAFIFPQKRYIYDRPKGYSRPKGTFELLPRSVCASECARRWEEEETHPTGGELIPRFSDGA